MKKYTLLLSIFFVAGKLFSQQLPQYSSYMINDYVLNPAITGVNDFYEAKALNRYQWLGIDDAPRTYIVSVHGPMPKYNMGIGGFVFSDVTGPTSRNGGYLTYAYHLKLADKLKLNLGLAAGFLQFKIDGSKISTNQTGDPILNGGVLAAYQPDFNFGFYLNHEKYFFGGAINQLIGNRLKFFKDQTNIRGNLNRHLLIQGGYNLSIRDMLTIQPSFLLKYVAPVPMQWEAGLKLRYKELFWLGGTYRHKDAFVALAGFNIAEKVMVGYSYDFAISNLRNYSNGTHEIMIGARFGKIKNSNPESIVMPEAVPESETPPTETEK